MTIHEASRTLLKSPPELWAECSDATSLNRHLDQFGEIRITRLEPETAVAWEGENASGTVRLEPSGWGTRVILTAEEIDPVIEQGPPSVAVVEESEPEPVAVEPEPLVVEPEPVAVAIAPAPPAPPAPSAPRVGFFARLMARMRGPEPIVEEPTLEPLAKPDSLAEPEPLAKPDSLAEPEPLAEPDSVAESESVGVHESVTEPEPTVPQPAAEAPVPGPSFEACEVREPEPPVAAASTPLDALTGALDSLGMAHHRPYSRS